MTTEVRVRISVALALNGQYDVACEHGDYRDGPDDAAARFLGENTGQAAAVVHHVIATLPIPEGVDVEGQIND